MAFATQPERTVLADQLQRAFHGGAWHGPSLSEVVAGVDAETARWRPRDDVHSIAELVGHIAFWTERVGERLAWTELPPVPDGADWRGAAVDEEAWQRELAALGSAHQALVAALGTLADAQLDEILPGSDSTCRGLLLGLLQHNAYHGGQISLLRRQALVARGGP